MIYIKNALKALAVMGAITSIGGGIYLFASPQTKKKMTQTAIDKMNCAEAKLQKKN